MSIKISGAQMVRDYVAYHKGKILVREIQEATGLDSKFINRRLHELKNQGLVRVIGKDKKRVIWMKCSRTRQLQIQAEIMGRAEPMELLRCI